MSYNEGRALGGVWGFGKGEGCTIYDRGRWVLIKAK
jgi:hypothetical protein